MSAALLQSLLYEYTIHSVSADDIDDDDDDTSRSNSAGDVIRELRITTLLCVITLLILIYLELLSC